MLRHARSVPWLLEPRRCRALRSRDKSCWQPAFFPKPVFNPAHGPCISLVIVPDQMQETMECKYAQLSAFGVAS
jgi:hypothetical protein